MPGAMLDQCSADAIRAGAHADAPARPLPPPPLPVVNNLSSGEKVATGKPSAEWDQAFNAASELWPEASEPSRKGWAGEIKKLVKRSGVDPVSATRLAEALMRMHGLRGLGQLSNQQRSALVSRLPNVLALQPSERQLADRWSLCQSQRNWPNDLGQRVEALLRNWDVAETLPPPVAFPTAASKHTAYMDEIDRRLIEGDRHLTTVPTPRERFNGAIDVTGQLDKLTKELGA